MRTRIVIAAILAACFTGCTVKSASVNPPTAGITASQQTIAGAAAMENSVAQAIKGVQDTVATLTPAVISKADQAKINVWLVAIARQNDSAIALTRAALASGNPASISSTLLALANTIQQQPTFVDIKNPTSQAEVQSAILAVTVLATAITQEFAK